MCLCKTFNSLRFLMILKMLPVCESYCVVSFPGSNPLTLGIGNGLCASAPSAFSSCTARNFGEH